MEERQKAMNNKEVDARLGYNMCECGFEGISLKVAKRSSNQDSQAEAEGEGAAVIEDTVHVEDEIHGIPGKDFDAGEDPLLGGGGGGQNGATGGNQTDDSASHHSNMTGGIYYALLKKHCNSLKLPKTVMPLKKI